MRKRKYKLLTLVFSLGLLAGCGGGSQDFVSVGDSGGLAPFVVTESSATLGRNGDLVDTLELEGFDAQGNIVYPATLVPFSKDTAFPNFPDGVTKVQVDYLRNGGYLLFRAESTITPGQRLLSDPSESATEAHSSEFNVGAASGGGFELSHTVSGPYIPSRENIGVSVSAQQEEKSYSGPLKLKGICYSPAPINFSNKDAPSVGDLFWDTYVETVKNTTIYNWYGIWGSGALGDTGYYGRDDIKEIRNMGANSIRVYSMLSRQLSGGKDDPIPAPGTGNHFQHKQFLDRCWNNGNNPIYVLVGVPLPDVCFRSDIAPKTGEIAFWEYVLEETVNDTKDHPAVLGYVIMNEHDAEPTSFPRDPNKPVNGPYFPGEPSPLTEYFYGQTAKYADAVKAAAPKKLVGWALHDAPEFVQFASVKPDPGPTYMEQLKSFDFWGVNTYHNDSLNAIFGTNSPGNYTSLPANVKKPVLFTEFGWPATTHKDGKLHEDATTHANVAKVVTERYKEAFENPLLLGAYYFEFQDEWWKQGGGQNHTWDPTTAPPNNFPNGYWDEEGFGLFSTAPTSPREATDSPFPEGGAGPVLPLDTLTPRIPIIDALRAVYTDPKYR